MFDGALTHSGESSSFGPEMVTSRPVTLRLSRPAPGRSLGGTVTRVERPVRDAVTLLSRVVAVDDDVLSHIFDCTVYGPGGSREPNDLRLSWFVACATLAQALVTGRNRPAPFLSALEWLFGDPGVAHRARHPAAGRGRQRVAGNGDPVGRLRRGRLSGDRSVRQPVAGSVAADGGP